MRLHDPVCSVSACVYGADAVRLVWEQPTRTLDAAAFQGRLLLKNQLSTDGLRGLHQRTKRAEQHVQYNTGVTLSTDLSTLPSHPRAREWGMVQTGSLAAGTKQRSHCKAASTSMKHSKHSSKAVVQTAAECCDPREPLKQSRPASCGGVL